LKEKPKVNDNPGATKPQPTKPLISPITPIKQIGDIGVIGGLNNVPKQIRVLRASVVLLIGAANAT
jgi:hypothetical protein